MQCRFSKARIIDTFFSGLALKWNLRHLRLNLRRLSLNLRHRGASGLFRNSPADVRTSVAVALMLPIISMLAQLTGMKRIPVSCANHLVFICLSATLHRGDSTATTLYQYIRKEALPGGAF